LKSLKNERFFWKNDTPTYRLNGKTGDANALAEFTSHLKT